MKKLALTFLLISLTGCGDLGLAFTPINDLYPDLPRRVVDLKAAVTPFETLYTIYQERSLCGSKKALAHPAEPCSDWVIVQKGNAAADAVHTATDVAKANENSTTIVALQNAIGEFRKIVEVVTPTSKLTQ